MCVHCFALQCKLKTNGKLLLSANHSEFSLDYTYLCFWLFFVFSKMMLLLYKDDIKVVITTANLSNS